MSSKTASCAQDLLDACRTGDYKHFMECVTSGGVLYELDNGDEVLPWRLQHYYY